jgi:hypothetical protein
MAQNALTPKPATRLPSPRTLVGEQVKRTLALQNELLGDPLIDLKTAALAIGGCSYPTLNRHIAAGRLKVFRIGRGRRRVRLSSLREFLAQGDSQGVTP